MGSSCVAPEGGDGPGGGELRGPEAAPGLGGAGPERGYDMIDVVCYIVP